MRFVINPFTELLDVASLTGSGMPPVESLTGNSGGAVGPDPTTFNINVLGENASGINVVGTPGNYTLTIKGLASSTSQIGVTSYASNAEAALQISTVTALTPSNITSFFSTSPLPSSQGGTGLSSPAAHQLIVTNGSSPFTALGVAGNGQIPIGSIASDPVLANITSSGGTITITNGPGTIDLSAAATKLVQTLTGNSGGAISPTAGNINTLGTGSITVVGSGSTLTTQLTGLTNHDVLVGAGTATITNVSPSTSGFVLTSNGISADPSFQTVSASGAITTVTGNSGGAESPSAGNFNILGTGSITVAGTANTETVQLTGLTNHALQIGAGTATLTQLGAGTTGQVLQTNTTADPTWSTATYPSSTTINQILYSSAANTITGISAANNGTLISGATGVPSFLANGTTGQILTATTGSPPSWAPNSAANAILTITGNSGGAESPLSNNFNILGTGSITVAGSANTETVQLTGLTNHALQIGAGTATLTQLGAGTTGQVLQTNTTADPTWSTATYPASTTINQLLYSSAANTVSGLATANRAVFTTGSSGVPVATALATDGQLIIGSTSGAPSAATLSAGLGIVITNGSNTISIASTGGGITWTNVTGTSQTVAVNNAYLSNNAGTVAFALPATATIGDYFRIAGVQGAWTLSQAAGQQIKFGSTATTAGVTGSLASTDAGDSMEFVATNTSASTIWRVISSIGNITVA